MQPKPTENEPGIALGVSLVAILGALLVSTLLTGFKPGPVRRGPSTVLLGLYLMAWGTMFLASYFYSHKTFFLRALIWVCEHWSSPKGRVMAFFYAALALGLGGVATLSGLGLINVAS
ncbi:hypothetical protein [Xanthomonas arboricola]|uniref:hypothetical protein n=1 Tax=Xanthomonas arboricola TaxID=56448 RepID=UPI000CEEC9AE|nr:hypothetical protein [Xanthomonas arboricola]PPT46270.1 hypothetical protein XarjCFBP7652_17805 [Xanthomonas arboricola]